MKQVCYVCVLCLFSIFNVNKKHTVDLELLPKMVQIPEKKVFFGKHMDHCYHN